jgi:plastocyanin
LNKKNFEGEVIMKRTLWSLGIASVAILILMAAGARVSGSAMAQDTKPAEAAVKIDNFIFSPNSITVAAGTTVRWTNQDDIPHNIVSDDKSFKSKALDTDETFAYTFTKPGTYTYFCSIHPKMTGKIVVQ